MELSEGILYKDDSFTLRSLSMEDALSIAESCNDQTIHDWIGTPFPYTEKDAQSYISDSMTKWQAGETYNVAIVVNNSVVGMIGIMDIDRLHLKAEIGYWLAKDYRGKGLMTTAVSTLVAKIFHKLQLERLYAMTDIHNTKSGTVLERVGFQEEGILRQHLKRHGERRDHVYWGLLKSEFKY